MDKKREVTILLAVLNKAETIRDCVESLLKVKYPVERIMVIDGYSTDGTYEILKEYKDKIDLYRLDVKLSATINWALDKIKTEFVALTDGDCVVAPDWLDELLKGFDEKGVVATAGHCGTSKNVSTLQKIIGLELENRFKKSPKYILRAPTMNLTMKTEVAKKVRFDAKQLVGVETDFCYRLSKVGKMVYVPTAKVWHYHRANLGDFLKQQKNQSKFGLRIFLKHGTKSLHDHITTGSMVAQIPLLGLALACLVLTLFSQTFLYFSLAFFLVLLLIYLKNILEISPPKKYFFHFLGLFFLRTLAWLWGAVEGVFTLAKK